MALLKIQKDYMWFTPRLFNVIFCLLISCAASYSQKIVKQFNKDSASFYLEKSTDDPSKIFPLRYDKEIKIALSYYPELNGVKVKFRLKKQLAPLSARPRFISAFRKKEKRKYLVTISSNTITKLDSILLSNLSFNARIGVLGHELSHISEFNTKKTFFFIKLAFNHLFSKRSVDRFEYNTDKRCVEHRLGYQLLSWSNEVRQKLGIKSWRGNNNNKIPRERYMDPSTILKLISSLPIYL